MIEIEGRVVGVGPAQDKTMICITDSAGRFQRRWFTARPPVKKEMLDTALTAISSDLSVYLQTTSDQEYSEIDRIYVIR